MTDRGVARPEPGDSLGRAAMPADPTTEGSDQGRGSPAGTSVRRRPLLGRVGLKLAGGASDMADRTRASLIRALDRWPCTDRKYLLVGSESSGTTAVADFLFKGDSGVRYLQEGRQQWVWEVYQRVYAGQARVRDYPRLQLFDAIKVPGFAMIIKQFRAEFPDTRVAYMVRDPRDFVSSAFRTWSVRGVSDPSDIPWVSEDWLGIPNVDPVERLCLRWKSYLRSASDAGDVLFVRYEDFYDDKLATIGDMAGRLGLPFDAERVAARKDTQISGVRGYVPRGPGTWKESLANDQVSTVERICADEMKEWGYLRSGAT